MTHNRVDYEALNGRGVLLRTFSNLKLARSWMRMNASKHEGLHIDAVERQLRRVTIIPAEDAGPYLRLVERQQS